MKVSKVILAVSFLVLIGAFCYGREIPAPSAARLTPAVIAVKRALPWVVNIGTNEEIIQVNDPFATFFMEFFGNRRTQKSQTQYSPLGSGVVIDSRGLVLTHSHVVRRAAQIEVRLLNGKAYQASIVGNDVPNDLCLLKLDGDFSGDNALIPASFAYCNDLMLGESVIAIGNPYGLEHSVSQGCLSAFNRSFEEDGFVFSDILQTDAAINPGNSGGPLVNLDGQLIGMNLALKADAQGIGFAIPLSRIESYLGYWLKPSRFRNAFIGIDPNALILDAEKADGVTISEIVKDSPLAKAGLTKDSVIVQVNNTPVRRPLDFSRAIWPCSSGESLKITTADGKSRLVKAVPMTNSLLIETRLGMKVQELTQAVRYYMTVPDELSGVMVADMLPEKNFSTQDALWRHRVTRGDIIVSFDDEKISSVDELGAALAKCCAGEYHRMAVLSLSQMIRYQCTISLK